MFDAVCLISQNDFSREGLSSILSCEGFEVFTSVGDADEIDQASVPGDFMAIIDIADRECQQRTVEQIVRCYPQAMVVVLAEVFDLDALLDCLKSGVQGYIIKSQRSKPLITALRLAALGEKVFPSEIVEVLQRRSSTDANPIVIDGEIADAHLSVRERDVLCCLMAGYPNKHIARHLDVCEATVKVHVKAILRKLNVRNRTQAAIWASAHNLADTTQLPNI